MKIKRGNRVVCGVNIRRLTSVRAAGYGNGIFRKMMPTLGALAALLKGNSHLRQSRSPIPLAILIHGRYCDRTAIAIAPMN